MKKRLAKRIGKRAMEHLEETVPDTLRWARGVDERTFRAMKLKRFLSQYCFVVYASGFRFAVVEERFPRLKKAFHSFDEVKLWRMRSVRPAMRVIANERKAHNFLDGAQAVIDEGWPVFKRRVAADGVEVLQELPGIGPITQDHLAKNIGLLDVPKPDVWLERVAALCRTSVHALTKHLADELGETQHVVDIALWTLAKDGLLTEFGYQPPSRKRQAAE